MVWLPTLSELVLPLLATPPLRVTGLPKSLPSILNWTVPVGVPEPGLLAPTVALKLTLSPETEELLLEVTVVVVLSLPTVWLVVPVLALKLRSAARRVGNAWMAGP